MIPAVGLMLGFVAMGYVALLLPRYAGMFALIWLPVGLVVYGLLRLGLRYWPAVFLGSLILSLVLKTPLDRALILASFNTLGVTLSVGLMNRWKFQSEFRRGRDQGVFLFATLVGTGVMATSGSLALRLIGDLRAAVIDSWLTWWLSNFIGTILLTPFLLSLRRDEWNRLKSRAIEFAVWGALTALLSLGVFLFGNRLGDAALPLALVVMPLVTWSSMRLGLSGMSLGVLVICGLAVFGLAQGVGPFVHSQRSIELLQATLFLSSVILVGWSVLGLQRAHDLSEQQLRRSQESFELATLGSSDGFWDWNIEEDLVYNPQRWLCKLGYEEEDFLRFRNKEAWHELVHPEDRLKVSEALERHFARKGPYVVEYRLRTKSGEYRWILARGQAVWNEEGRVVRLAGSHTDITDRLAEQERLRLLELCLSRSNDVVMICAIIEGFEDPSIVYVNEAFARETGYSSDEALGRRPRFLEGPETPPAAAAQLQSAMARHEPVRVELVHYRKGGESFWVEVDMVPVDDGKGRFTHFVSIQRDITQRKREESERAAREEKVRTSQHFEVLGSLSGGFAHHFNNLLTAINGYIELARESLPQGHQARQDLDAALQGGRAAASLVSRLLVYARRIPEAKRSHVDLGALVRETLPLLVASVSGGVRFEQHLPANPVFIVGDTAHLQQALVNLCLNAAQATTQRDGVVRVTLRTAGEDAPRPELKVCLEVSDNGHGMTPEIIKRIFDPFFTTRPLGQGTGLGLSVVHGIISHHGGEIRVRSEPGRGSTFSVYFESVETATPVLFA